MGDEQELTILFADVVGSTRLYDVLGDVKARDTISFCVDVMTAATQEFNGAHVIKTMGDELMATFDASTTRWTAGARMHEKYYRRAGQVDGESVTVRIGCHYRAGNH